jgi:hypothetical protein
MVLAGVVAAAGGVLLGWQVPAPSPQALKAMLTPSAPIQTITAAERPAPVAQAMPAPAPAAGVPADKPEAHPEAGSDRGGFRLETRTTKMVIDPMRGRASLDVTPSFNITLDAGKREASLDAGTVHLGIGR